ncbi:hydroxypyruvate isomerase family protein [Roseibium sp.]|uniref:hydroxypyruvate isomerase family protein n=1 Tax=Roseibium sp. TaxID=1936156 RepID=UPI003A978D0E
MRFSANLGFLWNDRALPDAIRAAAVAGFDGVECHFPYAFDRADVRKALIETGLPMVGLNTRPGDVGVGDFGLCAIPGREAEAREAISDAIEYAEAIGCRSVHVMAGKADGREAYRTFRSALTIAADLAEEAGLTILIEPINTRDVPGYFLSRTEQAMEMISDLDRPNVKLMFDCYHMQIMEGDLTRTLERNLASIGHIQIAGVPSRQEPDSGELNYRYLFQALQDLGYDGFIGAEYRPKGRVEEGLGWLKSFRD